MTSTDRTGPSVREAEPHELEGAALVLVEAFDRDPLGRWLHPDADERRAAHERFFRSVVLEAPAGAMIEVHDDLDGVAVWYPPGTSHDGEPPADVSPEALKLFAEIDRTEPPGPFWYVAFLGARTSGGGAGSALLRHRMAQTAGPIALWTGNERNLGFYARFGFATVAHVAVEGAAAWWLTRPPGP